MLLALKASVTNWPAFKAATGLSGWDDPAAPGAPCNWGGVTCNGAGRVSRLALDCITASACKVTASGTLPTQLASLSNLTALLLRGQNFSGQLPQAWGAAPGAFTALNTLALRGNQLSGQLPASWAGGGFASLATLDLEANALSGTLPASWGQVAGALPRLATIILTSNALSGTLPPVRVASPCSGRNGGSI